MRDWLWNWLLRCPYAVWDERAYYRCEYARGHIGGCKANRDEKPLTQERQLREAP